MVVPTTSLAQAREVDDLVEKLRSLRNRESILKLDLETAQETVKELKAQINTVRSSMNDIIDELSGKKTYPLFEEIKKLEAEQDRLETDPIAASGEAPAQENNADEIKLERVGENKEKVKLVRGEESVEISLEEIELHFVGNGPDEYATYDDLCNSGWAELQQLEPEELVVLWSEYYKEPEVSNVVNFFGSETTETTPDEAINEAADYSKTTYIDTTPEQEQTEQTEQTEQKASFQAYDDDVFQVYVDNDARLCISYDHGERKSPFGSAAKILDRFGVSSAEKLKQKHLTELWQEDPSDWSHKVEVTNNEDWPEQIHALRKPDGSVILKLNGRTRKIDAGIVTPGDINFDNQDELNKLWLSDKAYDYNPAQEKTEISSLSGKKPSKKRKPAEVTL